MDIPSMIAVRQHYNQTEINNIGLEIRRIMREYDLQSRILPGAKVAITAGSRGIANIVSILAAVVDEVKNCGAKAFLIPTMGSHGGGTANGQKGMLEGLGITEESVGAPICATMDVVQIGTTQFGTPVYVDKFAYEADGIIVVNRIKMHTDHRNRTESGLMKMLTIGLGKQRQAQLVHSYGIWGLENIIPANAKIVIDKMNIVAGIAIIENALDETAYLEAIDPKDIPQRERELLKMANDFYPWLPFKTCDVLVIKHMGKNISGTGMDTNMIGRFGIWGGPDPEKLFASGQTDFGFPLIENIVVLDLSEESRGNAMGVGQADIITRRLFDKIDFHATYNNVLTSKFLDKGKIPIVAQNDRDAIEIALNSLHGLMRIEGKKTVDNVRVCVIDSTLHRGRFLVSQGLFKELKSRNDIESLGNFTPIQFDGDGNMIS